MFSSPKSALIVIACVGFFGLPLMAQIPEESEPASKPAESHDTAQPTSRAVKSYGLIREDRARVRGGPADFHADVITLERGDVVEIVGQNGKWLEILVPGGYAVYAKKGMPGRPYVDIKDDGFGVVLVDGLQIRPRASGDAAAIGRFDSNQKVVVLGEEGEWLKLLAPESKSGFIFADYVHEEQDTEALARDFAIRSENRRTELLKQGAITREALKKAAAEKEIQERLKALDERLVSTLRSREDTAGEQLLALAGEYDKFLAELPKDSPAAKRVADNGEIARTEGKKASDRVAAAKRINELTSQARIIEDKYAKDLEEKRKQIKDRETPPKKDHFLFNGIGTLRVDIASKIAGKPIYTLVKAGKRHFFVVSDRYDLSDFHDLVVGITEYTLEENPENLELKTIRVTRLEVLE